MTKGLHRIVPFVTLQRLLDSSELSLHDVHSEDYHLVSAIRGEERAARERYERTQALLAERLGVDPDASFQPKKKPNRRG
jgi:hypothetical protein